MSPAQVSAAIMEAYGEATRQAVARTQQLANERFGESRFATRLADFLPQPEPEDETR